MHRLLSLLVLTSLAAVSPAAGQAVPLQVGIPVPGELGPDDKHTYEIELGADQFVYGIADQQTVDVVVTVYGPDGERLGRWDGPARGPEMFQFDTEAAGVHRVEIAPFEREAGEYVVELERVEPVAETPEGRVAQLMAPYDRDDVPGGVVAVIRNGEVAFAEAYGMANLSHGIPFTIETPSNIGSVSKQFTAFAIVLLESRGKLTLDDAVREHIPELPAFDQAVTLRHLLNHTGGYRELYNTVPITGWQGEDELSRDEAIHIVQRQPALQTPPGSEYNYNNTGYILLAEVVRRVTGVSFPEWMEQNVFGPLGMHHTTIKTEHGQVIHNSAQGYVSSEEGGFREARDLAASYGAGGIYTTVGDLAKWLRNFHDHAVGGPEVMARMVERGVLTDGDTIPYALGLGIGERRGLRRISHGGADVAHRAQLMYFPEIDAGVVALSNNSSFNGQIPGEVADAFFAEHLTEEAVEDEPREGDAVVVAPEVLDRYVGRYEAEGVGLIITYTRDGDRFYAEATGQPEIDLIARSDSVFDYEGVEATVTFHVEGEGEVERATHQQGGRDLALRRLPPYAPTAEALGAYAGRYYSEELETFYTLVVEDTTLVAQHRRLEDDITLTPKSEDKFTGRAFFLREVEFVRADDGTVTGFRVSNGRTRGVLFEKIR
ncbi:MAG: serine hydrolase [Gemmatimonadales bacterium]|nr:serine hydrolase [Gemmatimonadales bacterium]NIN12676.1 serine hydrolase [Gemmatimonadales bacterium]NIN50956.1 serine hydrolase [Gemmatimonadales bacterium]NIP08420.1 serine hydrolase [Gemmatimonadales bacterium]NIR03604.1 serine hydrolase [Gemmatimonadales bacterium]